MGRKNSTARCEFTPGSEAPTPPQLNSLRMMITPHGAVWSATGLCRRTWSPEPQNAARENVWLIRYKQTESQRHLLASLHLTVDFIFLVPVCFKKLSAKFMLITPWQWLRALSLLSCWGPVCMCWCLRARAGDFLIFQLSLDKHLVSSKPMTKPKHLKKLGRRLVWAANSICYSFSHGAVSLSASAVGKYVPWYLSDSMFLDRFESTLLLHLPAVQKPRPPMLKI